MYGAIVGLECSESRCQMARLEPAERFQCTFLEQRRGKTECRRYGEQRVLRGGLPLRSASIRSAFLRRKPRRTRSSRVESGVSLGQPLPAESTMSAQSEKSMIGMSGKSIQAFRRNGKIISMTNAICIFLMLADSLVFPGNQHSGCPVRSLDFLPCYSVSCPIFRGGSFRFRISSRTV